MLGDFAQRDKASLTFEALGVHVFSRIYHGLGVGGTPWLAMM